MSNGYAERVHDTKDRRVVLVQCTDKGSEALQRIKTDMQSLLKEQLKDINEKEMLQFVVTFEKIAAELAKES